MLFSLWFFSPFASSHARQFFVACVVSYPSRLHPSGGISLIVRNSSSRLPSTSLFAYFLLFDSTALPIARHHFTGDTDGILKSQLGSWTLDVHVRINVVAAREACNRALDLAIAYGQLQLLRLCCVLCRLPCVVTVS